MMEAYGRALIEERLRSQRHAELAAYARQEYGPGVGPEFLIAEAANGIARKPRKRKDGAKAGLLSALAKAMKALVAGNGERPDAEGPNPTR